jgi:hypothetical protein
MRNQMAKAFVNVLALVLGIACTQSAFAQTFKRVNVKGGSSLVQIAAGGASVWALASNGNPYIFKTNKFVLANSISLTQIAVGGGNVFQADAVWGLDSSGLIYRALKSGTTWAFSQVPGILDLIAVGAGNQDNCHPYEVWGLNPSAQIYRYNFCGQSFEQVPGTLATLAVGGGGVWGINGSGTSFRFSFGTLLFDGSFGGPFTQITVGPNGVWAIDSRSNLRQYNNQSDFLDRRVGLETFTQVQVGGNGVWGLNFSGQVFRFEESTGSVVSIPSVFRSISAGSGSGVWGIDSSGKAYAFSTP